MSNELREADICWREAVDEIVRENVGSNHPEHYALIGALSKLDERDRELERLRAIEQRAIHVRDEDLAYDGGPEALYILGEAS